MRCRGMGVAGVGLAVMMVTTNVTAGDLMTAAEAMALPRPTPNARLQYGEDPLQFGELRLPDGAGPFPVAVIVHGGCWLAEYDLGYVSGLADGLARDGIATWSLEYRRVGDPGGGWPGTFVDVGSGADFLRQLAARYPLDLDRVVAIGHSAGGHLALWLAGRGSLAEDDPIRGTSPLPIAGVVALAGIPDLAAYSSPEGCGAAVAGLLGGDPDKLTDRLPRTSPIAMVPLGVRQRLIVGDHDSIVPASLVETYHAAARSAGDDVVLDVLPGVGHFETVAIGSGAWLVVLEATRSLLFTTE